MPDAIVEIKLQPKAKKNEIIGFKGNILYIKVTAPPVDSKANSKMLELLSDKLDIPKSDISIIKGKKAKYKIIKIENMKYAVVKDKLTSP